MTIARLFNCSINNKLYWLDVIIFSNVRKEANLMVKNTTSLTNKLKDLPFGLLVGMLSVSLVQQDSLPLCHCGTVLVLLQ